MLRTKLKEWEHEFFENHNRKPTSKDIKENAFIHGLYKQYHREKAAALRAETRLREETPPLPEDVPQSPQRQATGEFQDAELEQTPQKPKITEVFPTPQHQGRVLGLFEIQLPTTPVKPLPVPSTPTRNILVETPKSKRTPAYITQRGSAIYTGESPLFPRRASKSISQIIEEAENMSDIESDFEIPQSPSRGPSEDATPVPDQPDKPEPTATKWRKRGQKRTTKRVVMRPVTESDAPTKRKATENYRRLNIQKKRPFGKRSR